MNKVKEDKILKEPKTKQRQHFHFGKLFYNDQFVMVFSVFFALVLWVFMSFNNTEKNPRSVTDVQVAIKLSDAAQQTGLKVFSPVDAKARVWIKGNSITVNQVTSSDLQVVAQQAAAVSVAGNYVFDLSGNSIKKLTNLTDYTVTAVEPSSVNVYVDTYVEKVFHIDKSQIKYQIAPTCYMNEPTLSAEEITISGPQQKVDKIDKVVLRCDTGTTPLTSIKRVSSNVLLLDTSGKEILSEYIKLSAETVDITFNVLPRKVLPFSIDFTNMPSAVDFAQSRTTIEPKEIEVAGPADALANLTKLQLTPVDFSTISPAKNSFDADVILPASFKNVSNIYTVKVALDMSNISTRTVALNTRAIKFRSLSADYQAEVFTRNLQITVVGPESEISKITENNLIAQIDMTGKESFLGQTQMPAIVKISGFENSWVYGNYKVNIGVVKKASR